MKTVKNVWVMCANLSGSLISSRWCQYSGGNSGITLSFDEFGHSRRVVRAICISFSNVAPSRALIDIPCKIQFRYSASFCTSQWGGISPRCWRWCRNWVSVCSCIAWRDFTVRAISREEAASVAEVLIMKHPAGVSLLVKQVAIAVK